MPDLQLREFFYIEEALEMKITDELKMFKFCSLQFNLFKHNRYFFVDQMLRNNRKMHRFLSKKKVTQIHCFTAQLCLLLCVVTIQMPILSQEKPVT